MDTVKGFRTSPIVDKLKLKRPHLHLITKKKHRHAYRQSVGVGDDLDIVEGDKVTVTNQEENKHRRAIVMERGEGESWGFTIQSYGIHHVAEDEVELLTYVDYVAHNSPAFYAGMRAGDVILSINGTNMEEADHLSLITFIKSCDNIIRMVVLFEDCCRKVDLHLRYMKLKRVLAEKVIEVRSLEQQEMRVLAGLSRFDSCRSSRASSNSSNGFWDDRLSLAPHLDRCPTPRGSHGSAHSHTDSAHLHPDSASLTSFSSLPPSPHWDLEVGHSSRHHRPPSLAASASLNAAFNASLRSSAESLTSPGRLSPNLATPHGRLSPHFGFSPSPYNDASMDDSLREYIHGRNSNGRNSLELYTSTPQNRAIKQGRSLRTSGRHDSAPDALSIKPSANEKARSLLRPRPPKQKDIEMDMFSVKIGGAEMGKSGTDTPMFDIGPPTSSVATPTSCIVPPPKRKHKSFPPQRHITGCDCNIAHIHKQEPDIEKLSASFQSALSLNMEGSNRNNSSNIYQKDKIKKNQKSSLSSSSSSFSSSSSSENHPTNDNSRKVFLPSIKIEFVHEEDAISEL